MAENDHKRNSLKEFNYSELNANYKISEKQRYIVLPQNTTNSINENNLNRLGKKTITQTFKTNK